MACSIHSTAVVASGAELGNDVEVGPYSVIGAYVKVGDRSVIGSHAVIEGRTTLGADNRVYNFAAVGGEPQDLKYTGEPSTLVIGERNVIREFATLHRGTKAGCMATIVGNDNLFMAYSHVAHDCVVGNKCVFANSVALAGHVSIGNHVILGGLVAVHQFCRIGDYALLGGGTMADTDVPPFVLAQGDRARLRGLNLVGLRRAGFSQETQRRLKAAYRHLFSTAGRLKEKLESFPEELASDPEVSLLLEFIKASRRGICRPQKNLQL